MQWIFEHDKKGNIRYSNFETNFWKNTSQNLDQSLIQKSSVIVITDQNEIVAKSAAINLILKETNQYRLLQILIKILPTAFCNIFYDLFAKNRLKFSALLWGNDAVCSINPELRKRILT